MSTTLEFVRDKPLGFWTLDGTSPYTDCSGYGSAASSTSTDRHASLANGLGRSTIFSNSARGQFAFSGFTTGKEKRSFSLEAVVRPIIRTTGYAAQTYRENLLPNPSGEADYGWAANNSQWTMTWDTTNYLFGTRARKSTYNASILSAEILSMYGVGHNHSSAQPTGAVKFVKGQTYSASVWLYAGQAGYKGKVDIARWSNTTGTNLDHVASEAGAWVNLTANTWTKVTCTYTAPANATGDYLTLGASVITQSGANATSGHWANIDGAMLVMGTDTGAYFDGSMPGYEWVGTANQSVSRTMKNVNTVNLLPNPSAEVDATNLGYWPGTGGTATGSRVAGGMYGSTFYRMTQTVASSTRGDISTALASPVFTPGEVVSAAIYGRTTVARQLQAGIQWHTGNGSIVTSTYGPLVNVPANTWYRLLIENQTVPANASRGKLVVATNTAMAVGDILDFDAAIINRGAVALDYFDGSSSGHQWSGTAHGSASYRLASTGEQQILGHLNTYDGLTINGTVVSFVTKYSNGTECRASYDLEMNRAAHVVGVHSEQKNSLYINGELVAEEDVLDTQTTYSVAGTTLYSGQTDSSQALAMAAVAVYNYPLSPNSVARHAVIARDTPEVGDVSESFGGAAPLPDFEPGEVFLEYVLEETEDYDDSLLVGLEIDDGVLRPMTEDDISQPGFWVGVIPISISEQTSIYGVTLDWDSIGATVETSLDEITWTTVQKGQFTPNIPAGFNPTDKELYVRVSFAGGTVDDESYLTDLSAIGYYSATNTVEDRTVTYLGTLSVGREQNVIDYSDDWGITLDGTAAITVAPADAAVTNPKVVEFWVKNLGSTAGSFLYDARSSDGSGHGYIWLSGNNVLDWQGTLYINGVLQSTGQNPLPVNEWMLIHYIPNTVTPTTLHIGERYTTSSRGKFQIGHIAFYDDALTDAQIADIHATYTGTPNTRVGDNSIISIAEAPTAATIYAHDWSIQAAG